MLAGLKAMTSFLSHFHNGIRAVHLSLEHVCRKSQHQTHWIWKTTVGLMNLLKITHIWKWEKWWREVCWKKKHLNARDVVVARDMLRCLKNNSSNLHFDVREVVVRGKKKNTTSGSHLDVREAVVARDMPRQNCFTFGCKESGGGRYVGKRKKNTSSLCLNVREVVVVRDMSRHFIKNDSGPHLDIREVVVRDSMLEFQLTFWCKGGSSEEAYWKKQKKKRGGGGERCVEMLKKNSSSSRKVVVRGMLEEGKKTPPAHIGMQGRWW